MSWCTVSHRPKGKLLHAFLAITTVFMSIVSCAPNNIVPRVEIKSVQANPDGWNWYLTELQSHSSISDGYYDLGVRAYGYNTKGYNVTFLTEHNIKNNDFGFQESLAEWSSHTDSFGDSTIHTNISELSTTQVKSRPYSFHNALNASGTTGRYCERTRYRYSIANPIFHRGSMKFNFSIYPTAFTSASSGWAFGLYFGSDSPPYGLTYDNGTFLNKWLLLVYYISYAATWAFNGSDATYNRYVFQLSDPTLNQWNSYSLNVTDKLSALNVLPHGSTGLKQISIRTYSKLGKLADGYIDDLYVYSNNPECYGSLRLWVNSQISNWNTATHKLVHAIEFTTSNPNRDWLYYKYDFSTANEYAQTEYGTFGYDTTNIAGWAHNQGFLIVATYNPYYNNTLTTVNLAWQADLLETWRGDVVGGSGVQNSIALWDTLLAKTIILGIADSDAHGYAIPLDGFPSTKVYSSSSTVDNILKNLYEGRMFLLRNDFTGTLIFNTRASTEPYPSRYINYIADEDNATLYLNINQGLTNGWKMCWVRNGTYVENTTITGSSFTASKSYSMPNNANYWRVEVRDASDNIIAMSEPIFFKKVPNMPSGMYAYTYDFTTPMGSNYTNNVIKGITTASFSFNKLNLTVTGMGTSSTKIYVGDKGKPRALSVNEDTKSEGDGWTYNSSNKIVTVTWMHSSETEIILDWGGQLDLRTKDQSGNIVIGTLLCIGLGLGLIVISRKRRIY